MPLDVVYEDEDVIVVNKPPGMVVHPAPGHSSGTLVHALLAYRSHWSSIGGVERPGIVHRLDKGTSGLLAVACNDRSHQHLAAQLSKRTMKRVYHALVWGQMKAARGTVDKPIGRHPTKRKQMAVVEDGGRRAATHFRLLDQFPNSSLLEVRLETGRTHQVRVHLASLHHGVVGDTTYARSAAPLRDRSGNALPATAFSRPLLHAVELSFTHPRRGALVHCSAPVPLDFRTVLERLRRSRMPPASE
jgi:23S rRNA pseudouridine1911/1915/1917 synthase